MFFFVIFAFFGSFWLCWLFGFCWLLASALTVGFLAAFPPIDRPLVNGFLPATCRRAGIQLFLARKVHAVAMKLGRKEGRKEAGK